MHKENLILHTDKYEVNMMYAHWKNGTHHDLAVFEVYFRQLPFGNGYAVCAGLEQIVNYMQNLRFGKAEISYLASQPEQYDAGFLEELQQFRFTGNLDAVPEGVIVFPNTPLVRVETRIFEALIMETAILNFLNYQTLVTTKASRIKQVVQNEKLLEFGSRRAQESEAAIWGARGAYIAGFDGTSNLLAGMRFGIPTSGTHAHSWVQAHEGEEEAFRRYVDAFPNGTTLLVDTYDPLKSGLPNAIKIAKSLQKQGKKLGGIRLDSGDLAYLSKKARRMLDQADLKEVKIIASNDLDENIIAELKVQGAKIDVWGVGTKLITCYDQPALGGVYKMVAYEKEGVLLPVIKTSANPDKISYPGIKTLFRLFDKETKMAKADYVASTDETDILEGKPIALADPLHLNRTRLCNNYKAVTLQKPIFVAGKRVYQLPSLDQIRKTYQQQINLFWPEHLRKMYPEAYSVFYSERLLTLRTQMIQEHQ